MRRSATLVLSALTLAAFACATAGTDGDGIDARARAWEGAFNRGDAAGVVEIYAPDGMILPPNEQSVTGREAIRSYFAKLAPMKLTISITPQQTEARGDLAVRRGTWSMAIPGGTVVDRGKFLEVWHRVNGEWFMSHDMWNSDQPAAPMPGQ